MSGRSWPRSMMIWRRGTTTDSIGTETSASARRIRLVQLYSDSFPNGSGANRQRVAAAALVLDSVSSPITKRVYNLGLDEFFAWYELEPRPGCTKDHPPSQGLLIPTRIESSLGRNCISPTQIAEATYLCGRSSYSSAYYLNPA